ncbi:unnamed protein product [Gadus morhua 'NCC']
MIDNAMFHTKRGKTSSLTFSFFRQVEPGSLMVSQAAESIFYWRIWSSWQTYLVALHPHMQPFVFGKVLWTTTEPFLVSAITDTILHGVQLTLPWSDGFQRNMKMERSSLRVGTMDGFIMDLHFPW